MAAVWSGGGAIRKAATLAAAVLAALVAAALTLPQAAVGLSSRVLLDFGPNDAEYVRGFRVDWERDGLTRFHWTSEAANVSLPLLVSGEGARLRLRLRRHFAAPAQVRLLVEGRTVSTFAIQADPKLAYRLLEVPLPRLEGRHPFVLSIEASGDDGRGLGVALDWLELERGEAARFALPRSARLAFAAALAAAFLAPWLAGSPAALAAGHALLLLVAGALAGWLDPLAFERVVRLGMPTYVTLALAALALARWGAFRRGLRLESGAAAGALVGLVLLALVVRLSILLHPLFFYPDVRVHGLFALQLARRGFIEFLSEFTANQFRYSLGLQQVGGHWYAFPYPPIFYVTAAPLVRWLHYRPEVAVSLTGAVVNSLEVFIVFALARQLGLASRAALAASAVVPLLPLFLVRLSLAYFPALMGHAVDAVVVVYLVARYREIARPAVTVRLAALLALALLAYTQGILNFAVFLGQFLLLEILLDRTPEGRGRQRALVFAGLLAGVLSLSFYGRYVPTLLDMRAGRPMLEERILLDKFEQRARVSVAEPAPPDEDDPFTGPTLDLWRGVRKAGWRLYVFYGLFAPVVVVAVLRLAFRLTGSHARLVWAWALTYLSLNLASGGLPGPNLVRYNKDLEIVAPLFCVALGALAHEAWESRPRIRALGIAGGLAFVAYGATRAYAALAEKIILER